MHKLIQKFYLQYQNLFHLNYINNNYSIFKKIYKLEPGHYSEVFFKKNQVPKINTIKYWKTEKFSLKKKQNKYNECVDELDVKLRNIVKNQIFADVEVGTFLSGGVDSSLITAIAQEVSSTPLTRSSYHADEDFVKLKKNRLKN